MEAGGTRLHSSSIDQRHFGLFVGAQPVRKIKARTGRRTMPGWFPTGKGTLPMLRTESLFELDGLGHFEVNPAIVLMATQPHHLHYREPTGDGLTVIRTYTPDAALQMDDGSVVAIDFKPARWEAMSAWQEECALIRAAYEQDHGIAFSTITEESTLIEPRRTNVSIMLMHRTATPDPEAEAAVTASIERLGMPTTIGAVSAMAGLTAPPHVDRAFSTVLRLAVKGAVRLDLGMPLGGATPVLPPAARANLQMGAAL